MNETFAGRLDRLKISPDDFARRLDVTYEEIISWGKEWGHAAPKYAVALLDCIERRQKELAAIDKELTRLEAVVFAQRQAD